VADIRPVVEKLTRAKKMFTSVDVANEVKKSGTWMRNREVAAELRAMFQGGDPAFDGYDKMAIPVRGGSKSATLYLVEGDDPDSYLDRNQDALAPTKSATQSATKIASPSAAGKSSSGTQTRSMPPSSNLKRVPRAMTTQKSDQADVADLLDTDIVMTKVIKTKERIKIPGGMIRQLGWAPGQPADMKHIKTHNSLPLGVIVSKDYRVSIPRGAVAWGTNPVKVMLTSKNDIIFDKA